MAWFGFHKWLPSHSEMDVNAMVKEIVVSRNNSVQMYNAQRPWLHILITFVAFRPRACLHHPANPFDQKLSIRGIWLWMKRLSLINFGRTNVTARFEWFREQFENWNTSKFKKVCKICVERLSLHNNIMLL